MAFDPIGKILSGNKEKFLRKKELISKKSKIIVGKFDKKAHKLHEKIETKEEEFEKHKNW